MFIRRIRIRFFRGHQDPDPKFKNQIRGSGSGKNLTGSATQLPTFLALLGCKSGSRVRPNNNDLLKPLLVAIEGLKCIKQHVSKEIKVRVNWNRKKPPKSPHLHTISGFYKLRIWLKLYKTLTPVCTQLQFLIIKLYYFNRKIFINNVQ